MEGSNTAFCHASSPAPAVQSPVTTNAKSFEPPSSFVSHGLQHHSLEGYQNNPNSQVLLAHTFISSLISFRSHIVLQLSTMNEPDICDQFQISSPWEDDLQSLVLMGFRGNA
jgi:hypothetical protein